MNQAEGPARGGAEQDDDADPAPGPRATTHGPLLWIAGGAVLLAQAAIVILIAGRWRTLGAVLLAVATLGVVVAVMMPADSGWHIRSRRSDPERRRR